MEVAAKRRAEVPLDRSTLGRAEARALAEAVESGWVGTGVYARLFESRFAAFAGARRCAAVDSGTSAVHLALETAGARGGEVLLAPLDAVAAAHAVRRAGAVPVFCDVDPERGLIDPAAAEAALTPRTRAILAVHLRGHACDLDALRALARRRRLALVEDCCQAPAGTYKGRPLGTVGDAGCFSFGRHKTLSTEDGGALVYRRAAWEARLGRLRRLGLRGDGLRAPGVGWRCRMNDLSAVVGLAQLARWPELEARLAAARALYDEALAGHPLLSRPAPRSGTVQGWSYFSVAVDPRRRQPFLRHLRGRGVAARPWAPPVHRGLPAAERLWRRSVDLPFSAALSGAEAARCAEAVRTFRG